MCIVCNLFHGNVREEAWGCLIEICQMDKQVTRMTHKLEVEGRKLISRTLAYADVWAIKKPIAFGSSAWLDSKYM